MSETTTISACLARLPHRDLSRYRAVLSDIATAERSAGNYATAVWFTVLGAACEAEQRRRTGTDTELPDTEAALRVVLRSLADGQVAALLEQYHELARARSSTPSVTALTQLAGSCASLLDAELRGRGAFDAQTPLSTRQPARGAGWRQEFAGSSVAAAVARNLVPRAARRDTRV